MTLTLNISVKRPAAGETKRNVSSALINDFLLRGLNGGSPWFDLIALYRYRRRKTRKSVSGSRKRRQKYAVDFVSIEASKETENAWRRRVEEIKKLTSRDVRLKSSQIRKRLATISFAKGASISYDVPVDDLLLPGALSPVAFEIVSRPPSRSKEEGIRMPSSEDATPPHRSPLVVQATTMSPEEVEELLRGSPLKLDRGRQLSDDEVTSRLKAIIDKNRQRLAEFRR